MFQHGAKQLERHKPIAKNCTGIPDEMKTGFEDLSGLSFDDVRIHYNSDRPAQLQALAYTQGNQPSSPVIQRQNVFAELLDQENPDPAGWLDALLGHLGISGASASELKGRHMNYNQLNHNNILESGDRNTYGEMPNRPEATIGEYIGKLIRKTGADRNEMTGLMQMGEAVNGIARMLAHRLGDMSAADQIAQKLMERFQGMLSEEEAGDARIARIGAFARENPILMYLHHEINSHDAAVMLLERMDALGKNREETFELFKMQAQNQIRTMKELETGEHKNVHAVRTNILSIDDAAGLYSRRFLETSPDELDELEAVEKLRRIFGDMEQDAQLGKYGQANPTLEKARRHERKSFTGEEQTEAHIKTDLRNKALAGLIRCHQNVTGERIDDPEAQRILSEIVARISAAPITITRFASDLLSRELAQGQGDGGGANVPAGVLKAGTPSAYITLDELLGLQAFNQEIRYSPQPSGRYRAPRIRNDNGAGDIVYTSLLSEESGEGRARGISYPVFRSNKNRLFAARQKEAPRAVFGALCLLGEGDFYGLGHGMQAGTYGDVVFVFRPNAFRNCMYTFGDRMRGYTNLTAFVYNAFAIFGDNAHFQSEILVPGAKGFSGIVGLANDLVRLGKGLTNFTNNFEMLEVQIFDTIRLSKRYIQEVVFAQSIPEEQRLQIKSRIEGGRAEPPEGQQDIRFYAYASGQIEPPTSRLYDKSTDNDREKMTDEQMMVLLSRTTFENDLKERFGFHDRHRWKGRTEEENAYIRQLIAQIRRLKQQKEGEPLLTENDMLNRMYQEYMHKVEL